MTGENSKREMVTAALEHLEAIGRVWNGIEEKIAEDKDSIPWERISDGQAFREALRVDRYLEYTEANIGRQSMLIFVCALLEAAIGIIGDELIPEYGEMLREQQKKNQREKKRASWFETRHAVFVQRSVPFGSIEEDCSFIENVIRVRNCLVHAGGSLERDKYSQAVTEAVKWLQIQEKEGNFHYVDSRDGLLYLRDNIVPRTIIASREIIEHLLRHVDGRASRNIE